MKKGIGGVADKLTIFLGLEEGLNGPCEADAVQRFCKDANLKDIDVGIGESGRRKASWIDDRNSKDLTGSGNARLCENMLTATGLLRYLKKSICPPPAPDWRVLLADLSTLIAHVLSRDTRMRMSRMQNGVSCEELQQVQIMCAALTCYSYIADLSPDFILALAVTVPVLQTPPLRDAIYKHVAFQSSIRINITVSLFSSISTLVNSISFANALNCTSPVDRPSFGWLSICRSSR
jgi:hypothetical protein